MEFYSLERRSVKCGPSRAGTAHYTGLAGSPLTPGGMGQQFAIAKATTRFSFSKPLIHTSELRRSNRHLIRVLEAEWRTSMRAWRVRPQNTPRHPIRAHFQLGYRLTFLLRVAIGNLGWETRAGHRGKLMRPVFDHRVEDTSPRPVNDDSIPRVIPMFPFECARLVPHGEGWAVRVMTRRSPSFELPVCLLG